MALLNLQVVSGSFIISCVQVSTQEKIDHNFVTRAKMQIMLRMERAVLEKAERDHEK